LTTKKQFDIRHGCCWCCSICGKILKLVRTNETLLTENFWNTLTPSTETYMIVGHLAPGSQGILVKIIAGGSYPGGFARVGGDGTVPTKSASEINTTHKVIMPLEHKDLARQNSVLNFILSNI
jgi:hypothetical protein